MKNLKSPVGVSYNRDGIQLIKIEQTARGWKPKRTWRVPILDKPLTRIQAIDLALLLIKAAQS